MKIFIPILLLFTLSTPVLAKDVDWYMFGGLSMYQEDVDATVGEGAGYRLGIGTRFNSTLGLEFVYDRAPALNPASLRLEMEDILETKLGSYEIKTIGNSYTSLAGTLTFSNTRNVSTLFKLGLSNYTAKIETMTLDGVDFCNLIECENTETEKVFWSIGALIDINKKFSFELTGTHIFGEGEALSFNGVWRYKF